MVREKKAIQSLRLLPCSGLHPNEQRTSPGTPACGSVEPTQAQRTRVDGAPGVTTQQGGENHEVVPNHRPIKTGTLSGVLKRIAAHHRLTVEDLLKRLGL